MSFSTSNAILAIALLLLVQFVFKIIYRLTYHPLATFPGPKIAAITYLYEYYYDLLHGKGPGGRYHIRIDKLHEKYGPIIRVNPDEVHIKDSSYYSTVYASAPARLDKHHTIALVGGDLHSVFGTQEHELHRVRKAAIAPLFSKRSINESQQLIWSQAALLWPRLESLTGPFDLHEALLAITTDIAGMFAMGKPLGLQQGRRSAKAWKTTIYSLAEMTPLVRKMPWTVSISLSLPLWITQSLAPKFAAIAGLYNESLTEAQAYLAQDKFDDDTRNVYEQLRASSLPDSDKYIRRYADEALVILLAGSETTAATMTHTIFHVLNDAKILAKLREETAEAYPDATAQPSLAKLQNLPYLNAVIRESMRLTSMFVSRMTILPHEELEYRGWKIPPMTAVSMNSRDVLHDPQIWPEPWRFMPQRWIIDGKRNTDLDRYWVPFGRGPRTCIGIELALAELFIIISSMLQRYDLELHDTEWKRDVELTRDCFIGMPRPGSQGVRVIIHGLLA